MKITIDLDDAKTISTIPPSLVYKRLCDEYFESKSKEVNDMLICAYHFCNVCAIQVHSRNKGRASKIKATILTYKDAEECFKIFCKFLDVWASEIMKGKLGEEN